MNDIDTKSLNIEKLINEDDVFIELCCPICQKEKRIYYLDYMAALENGVIHCDNCDEAYYCREWLKDKL